MADLTRELKILMWSILWRFQVMVKHHHWRGAHFNGFARTIDGQHVMIVEDIVDSGNTLKYLHKILKTEIRLTEYLCVGTEKEG
jgi:hypoxanthine-guanine phosphoribosyltransferase